MIRDRANALVVYARQLDVNQEPGKKGGFHICDVLRGRGGLIMNVKPSMKLRGEIAADAEKDAALVQMHNPEFYGV